jgi:hypothetical protein
MPATVRIKAISLKQPWANLVASGKKTIETRTWKTSYRGPLLIVSSKKPPIEPAGNALAVADLVDCRPMTKADEKKACIKLFPGAYAWILKDTRRIKPFPLRGSLGLLTVIVEKRKLRGI